MKNISEKTLLAVLIGLVVIFGIFLNSKLDGKIDNLVNQISNLSATVSSQNQQIGGLYSEIEGLLQKQASIIDSYDISYGAFNSEDMTYEVALKVTPKEYTENTKATVSIGDFTGDIIRSGTSFSATLQIPIAKEGRPTITFSDGEGIANETLNDTVSFQQNFLYQTKCGFSGSKSYQEKQLSYDGKIFLFFIPPKGSLPESARILALVNGEQVLAQEISIQPQSDNDIEFSQAFPINPGDQFTLYAEIRDKGGIIYRYPIDSTAISSDGLSQSENYSPDQCIIFDKNGNEIQFE